MPVAIQATKAVVMALKEADAGPATCANMANAREVLRHRHGGSALRQPAADLKAHDKYMELMNFEMEVVARLQTKAFKLNSDDEVPIKKILARKGGTAFHTVTNSEKEACKTKEELFKMLNEKFKLQHNKTILSLQYCKLSRNNEGTMQEWMDRF